MSACASECNLYSCEEPLLTESKHHSAFLLVSQCPNYRVNGAYSMPQFISSVKKSLFITMLSYCHDNRDLLFLVFSPSEWQWLVAIWSHTNTQPITVQAICLLLIPFLSCILEGPQPGMGSGKGTAIHLVLRSLGSEGSSGQLTPPEIYSPHSF